MSGLLDSLLDARLTESAQTARLSVQHAPIGKGGTNWITRSKPGNTGQLPAYIQNVRNAIMRGGVAESRATAIAIGRVRDWAEGKGNVSAEVRAAAAKAIAQFDAMRGKSKLKEAAPTRLEAAMIVEAARARLGILREDALETLLEADTTWSPTLKRCASGSSEMTRHEVHDAGQHVGYVSERPGYMRSEPKRYRASAINGDTLGDMHPTQAAALDTLRRHLEEGPMRVEKHGSKHLVARPDSYSGPTRYTEYPSHAAARYAAGLPEKPSTPEKQATLMEALLIDAQLVADYSELREDNWIKSAITRPGQLHRDLGVPEGKKIPRAQLEGAAKSHKDPKVRRRAQLALSLGKMGEAEARPSVPLAEAFTERLHPRAHGGPHGGEFVKKLFGARDTLGAIKPTHKDRIPEGSGPMRPSAAVTTLHVPRAPGTGAEAQLAREQKGVNQRKLTDKELPKAVGRGPWDAAVEQTVKTLRSDPSSQTDKLYRDASGHYAPERIELHARIIRALMQGAGAHPQDKQAIFLAGGPASGKSTLLKSGHLKPPSDAVEVNPDVIKAMLPEYKALVAAGDQRAAGAVHEESAHIAAWLTRLAMAREHHVVIDGVGNSEPGKFAHKVQRAVDHGYNTSVHYATIDTEEAVKRAEARAKNPKSDSYGRVVNQGYLRSAHASVTQRFNEDVRHMKDITVRVNDTHGKKPKVIYERLPGQAEKIRDKTRFAHFQAKAPGGQQA